MNKKVLTVIILAVIALVILYLYSFGPFANRRHVVWLNPISLKPKKRMDLGLTMKDIAKKAGVTETTVYNWEVRNIKPYRRIEEKLKNILNLNKEVPI